MRGRAGGRCARCSRHGAHLAVPVCACVRARVCVPHGRVRVRVRVCVPCVSVCPMRVRVRVRVRVRARSSGSQAQPRSAPCCPRLAPPALPCALLPFPAPFASLRASSPVERVLLAPQPLPAGGIVPCTVFRGCPSPLRASAALPGAEGARRFSAPAVPPARPPGPGQPGGAQGPPWNLAAPVAPLCAPGRRRGGKRQ